MSALPFDDIANEKAVYIKFGKQGFEVSCPPSLTVGALLAYIEGKTGIAKKNQKVEATWHSHPTKISAVLYLTDSNLCTIFNQCAINLRKNTWLLFNGKEMHTTQEGITNSDRLIIATDLCK